MNTGTGRPRSYIQTIVVIVTLVGVIYMITQTLMERSASREARNAAEVSQAVLTGGEVSEALLIAELSSARLEDLKRRGVISCAEGNCSVDTGVLVIAQDAADAAIAASATGEQAKAGVKTSPAC